jgi:hypothetical protein
MDWDLCLSELQNDIAELVREVGNLKLSALAAIDSQLRTTLDQRLGSLEIEAAELTECFQQIERQHDSDQLVALVKNVDDAWSQLRATIEFAEVRGLPQIWRD